MNGLRRRPTYNELIEQVENSDDIIKKYPDRRASFMRNHPYLTTLDGENFMEAINMQQNNMIRAQQKDLLIRDYVTQNGMSHLETKATMTMSGLHKATQAPETQYYDMSDSSPGLSPPGTVQTYDTPNTPYRLIGRSPPSHHSIIPPTPHSSLVSIFGDPPLPPDYTADAEDDIEEEKNRRLAERVSKRIEAEAKAKAMLNQLPKRRLEFEEEEPKDTGSSSSSSGMKNYIPGVGIIAGGVGKAAANMSGAGQLIGTIAGTTVGVAAIGAIETGSALYHTGAAAAGIVADYFGEGGEDSLPSSAVSSPEPKEKAKRGPKPKIKEIFSPSPEATHEPKGPVGNPNKRSQSLHPPRKDEDKPAGTTRSGKS